MPRKYTLRSKEEKLSVVKRNLAGESACSLAGELGCSDSQVRSWVKVYHAEGEAGLEQKKKPGNRLSRYERRKELSYEESLQYQVELPKRELVRKDAEVLRLKNGTNAEIQKQTGRHSVRELCSIYGVSRSGYYKWLKRAGQVNRYEKIHEILDRYVLDTERIQCYSKHVKSRKPSRQRGYGKLLGKIQRRIAKTFLLLGA